MSSIDNIFSKLRPKGRDNARSLKARPLRPGRDWLIGLFIFTLIVSGGSVASGILFVRYSTITVGESSTEIAMPRYNEVRIDEALAEYDERRQSYDKVVKGAAVATSTPVAPVVATTSIERLPVSPEPQATTTSDVPLDFE